RISDQVPRILDDHRRLHESADGSPRTHGQGGHPVRSELLDISILRRRRRGGGSRMNNTSRGRQSASISAARNISFTRRLLPGPSAWYAATTSGDRLMPTVRLRSSGGRVGRPGRRLAGLLISGPFTGPHVD